MSDFDKTLKELLTSKKKTFIVKFGVALEDPAKDFIS